MKRERLIQIVLVIVGLLNVAQIYFLYMDLWHSSWLLEQKNETHPMFLSFLFRSGSFSLIAARKPSEYRSAIALAAWLAHLPRRRDGDSNRGSVDSRRPPELCGCDSIPRDRSRPVSASARKTRGSHARSCVNELRNPTRLAIPLGDTNCPPPTASEISTKSRIVRSDIGISNFNCR